MTAQKEFDCIYYPMCHKAYDLLYCPKNARGDECEDYKPPAKSDAVLDELKGDRSALSLRLVQIYPQLNEDEKEYLFGCIEVILSRVELRSQHKGGGER